MAEGGINFFEILGGGGGCTLKFKMEVKDILLHPPPPLPLKPVLSNESE